MMSNTRRNIRLGIFLNIGIGIVFLIAAVIAVISVNDGMHRQALMEAESKARIILDRNLATHTYFTKIMKPKIFKWTESLRTKDYFDPTWMSSTFAIREIEKYFKASNPSGYFFKDAALDARSPENEADGYERLFLEKINADKKLETESSVRRIDGKPFLVVLRRGEVMEASCLKCHANPKDAPRGLIDFYGSERSFNRKVGDAVSAVSLRIPLAEAYAGADIFSLKLSTFLIVVLACLFTAQYLFYRRYLLRPLHVMQEKAAQITTHEEHLGEQIPQPLGRELGQLATAFNEMSVKLRHDRDHLEELVEQRTAELKLANEQFRQQRDFSKSLINTAQVILLVLDTEGRIVNFNPYLEEISGYTLEEVEGRDWFSIFLPESDRQRGREFFLKAVGTFQTKGKVDRILTKDGRMREIEWYDKTLKDTEGRVIGLLAIGHDITERKRAEEVLRQAEEKYRSIFENVVEGIFQTTPEGRFLTANPGLARLYGYSSPEEMIEIITDIGRQVYVNLDERLEFLRILQEKGAITGFELQLKRKDGSAFWASINARSVYDENGNILYHEGTSEDITERKRAEERLQESEVRYKALFAGAPEGIVVADLQTKQFRYANPAMCRMLGYTEEELMRLGVADIHPKESLEHVLAEFEAQARGEKLLSPDLPCLRKDGALFYANISGIIMVLDGRECIVGFFTDITERRQAEEALRLKNEMLQVIFDSAPVMIAFLDREGHHQLVNRCWQSTLGWSLEEAMYKDVLAEFYPDPAYRKYVLDYIKGAAGRWGDFKTRTRDGRVLDTSWANIPLSDGSNIGIGIDITDRKRAEEEKRRLEERSRKVVEDIFRFIPEGVLVFSRKMELLRQNQAFRELVSGYARRLGFAEDELENLIIDKIKAGMGDKNIKEIRISRKHETGK